MLCTPVQTHGLGTPRERLSARARRRAARAGGGGEEEEARRFLSLKLSRSDFFFYYFFFSLNLSLDSFPEVPLAFPDHLTAGFERPRLT